MSLNSRDQGGLGKYRVIAELGHGGMADVYLAVVRGPVGFNKLMVIKQLRPHLAEVPDFLDMFLDEARLAARLNHPNVVQTNEIIEEGNRYVIAMEYLDGQSFDRVLRRGQKQGKLTRAHQLRVLCEALEGLHYAHELQDFDGTPLRVVHRDVTPHNIFVTYEGQVKVVDFGIAKAANCSAETRTGVLKGKVAYMAPEQARGDELDRRADLFSVGLMLWEVAAGMRPWKGLNDVQILGRLATGQIPAPSSVSPEVDPELERICLRAIAMDPAARYATAAEMREELERYIEGKNLRVSSRELGAVVAELFQERRAELRSLIESQLRDARSLPTGEFQAVRAVSLVDLSSSGSLSSLSSSKIPAVRQDDPDASPRSEQTPAGPSTNSRVMMASLTSEAPPPRSNKALVGLAAAGAAALALVAFLALRPGNPPAAEAATSAAPPEAPAAALCEVKLKASPAEARLFLDDAPLPSNPFSSRFPRDGAAHRLRVEAPGHTTRHELISFDKPEVSLEIPLAAEPRAQAEPAEARPDPRVSSRPQPPPQAAGKGAAPRPTQDDDPTLPPPKVKKTNKRQLDGDDPWAKLGNHHAPRPPSHRGALALPRPCHPRAFPPCGGATRRLQGGGALPLRARQAALRGGRLRRRAHRVPAGLRPRPQLQDPLQHRPGPPATQRLRQRPPRLRAVPQGRRRRHRRQAQGRDRQGDRPAQGAGRHPPDHHQRPRRRDPRGRRAGR
jgi:serine/threonine-protein kinase